MALVALVLLTITANPIHAETVTTWTRDQGTAAISGANTATVVLGTGANNSASSVYVSGALSGSLALAGVGENIQMSGTMNATGVSNGNIANSFTFGLYNTNGSANATGWLGYGMGNGDTTHIGSLLERTTGNTAIYGSVAGAAQISSSLANANLLSGTYSFTLTLTRLAGNALSIDYSLTGTGYAMTGGFTDTTGSTFNFNRVGFISDGSGADQFTLSNVTVTAIPEPSTALLLAGTGLGLLLRRRRGR